MLADNFHSDVKSPNPARDDVNNHSISIENIPPAINHTNTSSSNAFAPRSASTAVKLGLVMLAVCAAIFLCLVFARNGPSSDDGVAAQAASGISIAQQSPVSENDEEIPHTGVTGETPMVDSPIESKPDVFQSNTSQYYTSSGPLQGRMRLVSPSILDGYETCSDLESDIAEALKLYMDEIIMWEAVVNEIYSYCDLENDNWFYESGFNFFDDQYYYGECNSFLLSFCSSVYVSNDSVEPFVILPTRRLFFWQQQHCLSHRQRGGALGSNLACPASR